MTSPESAAVTFEPSPVDGVLDSVAQSIFGIGLQLEECLDSTKDAALRAKIDGAITGLHDIIAFIRQQGGLPV